MEGLNEYLFLIINSKSINGGVVLFAQLSAEWTVVAAIVIAMTLVMHLQPGERLKLLEAGAMVFLAMAAAYVVRSFWPHPRPFMLGLGHTLAAHAPTASFPSFHATFLFSLGLGLLVCGCARSGAIILSLGFLGAWARIFIGVHFPFDMIGAFAFACAAVLIVRSISSASCKRLCSMAAVRFFRREGSNHR